MPAITNLAIFTGAGVVGEGVLGFDSTVAVSFGILVVMLKMSFEMGKLVRGLQDWSEHVNAWKIEVDRWRREVDGRLAELGSGKKERDRERKL